MHEIKRFMELGGPLMWPLLVCSVLLLGVLLERVWVLVLQRSFSSRITVPRLTAHRRVLPFFQDVPPSLGLLGTVIGVVQSFSLMEGRIDAEAVGAGLGVACITTVFGLGIAIIASVASYLCDWSLGDRVKHESGVAA